ncbi:MAG: hypothetical protein PHE80_06725 [Candidatus Omnitrophica bacterium]|nr:hypothetical protein [Candidatus Omnitrophota bacterium]MDD5738054.1 hypothetical protein [Candidatus Omnitrophota bacterium]
MRGRSRTNGNRRGAVLFGVLVVVLTVSLIGASLVALLSSIALTNQYEVSRAKALYLAEAGISQAVFLLKSQAIIIGSEEYFVNPTSLGDGTYEVKLDFRQSLLSSTGKVGGITRTIQLKFNSF